MFQTAVSYLELYSNQRNIKDEQPAKIASFGKAMYVQQFHEALQIGDLATIRHLVRKRNISVNLMSPRGFTSLQESLFLPLERNRPEMFRYLLKRGADYSATDAHFRRDTLGWACLLSRKSEVSAILEHEVWDVDYKKTDTSGDTYMHLAVVSGNASIARWIARTMHKFGLSIDLPNDQKLTPYLLAYRLGFLEIAEMLAKEYGACETQFDCSTFRTRDYWVQIGYKERQRSQLEALHERKNQLMIKGRINDINRLKVNDQPKLCLVTSDDRVAVTGIDVNGHNWTYLLPTKSDSRPVTRSTIALSDELPTKHQPLPAILTIKSYQSLPCWKKEISPPVHDSLPELLDFLKTIKRTEDKEAWRQKRALGSRTFSRALLKKRLTRSFIYES